MRHPPAVRTARPPRRSREEAARDERGEQAAESHFLRALRSHRPFHRKAEDWIPDPLTAAISRFTGTTSND
jgi:hypothetical protein